MLRQRVRKAVARYDGTPRSERAVMTELAAIGRQARVRGLTPETLAVTIREEWYDAIGWAEPSPLIPMMTAVLAYFGED